jgi:hypothetical protein
MAEKERQFEVSGERLLVLPNGHQGSNESDNFGTYSSNFHHKHAEI